MATVSLHATAVAVDGLALVIAGPSGAGKSSVAAGLIALGAGLVCDDLVLVSLRGGDPWVGAPPGALPGLEMRGWGIVPVPLVGPARVAGVLRPGAAPEGRLPAPEVETLLDRPVPLLRHPLSPDLPAKALLWLRGRDRAAPDPAG